MANKNQRNNQAMERDTKKGKESAQKDGFRYDYNDPSEFKDEK